MAEYYSALLCSAQLSTCHEVGVGRQQGVTLEALPHGGRQRGSPQQVLGRLLHPQPLVHRLLHVRVHGGELATPVCCASPSLNLQHLSAFPPPGGVCVWTVMSLRGQIKEPVSSCRAQDKTLTEWSSECVSGTVCQQGSHTSL